MAKKPKKTQRTQRDGNRARDLAAGKASSVKGGTTVQSSTVNSKAAVQKRWLPSNF